MEGFQSSYLSWEGELLNRTWNDTSDIHKKQSNTIWEWDDATWVMSACFVIFGMVRPLKCSKSGLWPFRTNMIFKLRVPMAK